MPFWIAGGLLAGGLGLSALGASAQQGADDAAAANRDAALRQFTGVQDAEFDRRNKLLGDSSKRIGDIKDQTFAQLLALRKGNAAENAGIKTKYSNATSGAQLQTADIKDNVDASRNILRDASDIELNDKTTAERARQQAFQRSGTDLAKRLTENLGRGGFARDVGYYQPVRNMQITAATAGDGTTDTPFNVDPTSAYGRELAKTSGSAVGIAHAGSLGAQSRFIHRGAARGA